MHVYSTGQWVLLFFFYCFCGWVWESCYVSLRQRRWVNRGFLHGPLLPIYGSGAVLILFVTLPAADDLRLVWLLGMITATALEYVTGAAMERIFRARYWDYSNQRCNLHGYICLTSSIAWGFFSILLVRFLHPLAARLLANVPSLLVDPAAHALAAVFTVDVVFSVQAALDLRDVLTRLTEENEELRRFARRAEIAAAFAEDDLRRFRERTDPALLRLRAEERRESRRQRAVQRRTAIEERFRRRTAAKLEALEAIASALEASRARLEEHLSGEVLENRRADLDEAVRQVRERQAVLRNRSARTYRRSLRILRGNPTVRAQGRQQALEALRDLSGQE